MFGRNRGRWMTYAETWRRSCVVEANRGLRRHGGGAVVLLIMAVWFPVAWVAWLAAAGALVQLWPISRWWRFRSKARRGLIYPPEFVLGPGHAGPGQERGWRDG